MASTRPTSRAGTATVCRSSCRWRRSTAARAASSMRAPSAPPAAPMRRSRSSCSAPTSSASGYSGTGSGPYLTMAPQYEAQQLRAFGRIIENGHLYKGVKPVHWCLDCRSALAEAEVEYEERTSPAIDVGFRVADNAELARAARAGAAARSAPRPWTSSSGPRRPGRCRRTRRWRCSAEFTYVLAEARQGASVRRLILAAELMEPALQALRHGRRARAGARGRAARSRA